ncbi:MAG: hypothetical protein QOC83_89, partial [Pseudonocardiales bacterium]|nr:hypothetical protein [Pseudonocardiales bacterium]
VADRVGAATGGWVEQLLDRVLSGVGKLVGSLGSMSGNSGQSGTGTASGTGQTSTVAQGQNGSVGQPAAQEANAGRMSALRAAIDDPSTAADVPPAELAQAGVSGADVAKLLAAAGQPSQQRSRSNSSSPPAGLSGAGLSGPSVEQLLSGAVDLVSGVVTTVGGRAAGQRTHAALTQVTDQVESALAASAALNNGTNGAGLGGVAGGRQPAVAGSRPERDAGPTTTSRPRGDGDSGAVAELVSRVTGCATAGAPGCLDDVVDPLSRFVESLSGRGPPAAASTDTSTSSGQTDRGSSDSAGSSSTQALSDQVESAKSQLSPAIAKLIDNIVSSATRMAAQAKSAAATPQRGSRPSSTTVLPGSTDTGSGGWVGQLVDQLMSGLGELTPQLTAGQRSGPARQLTSAAAAPTAAAQDAGSGAGQLSGGLVRFIGNVLAEVGQFLGQLGTQPGTTGPGGNPTGSQGSDNQGSGNQGSGGAGQSTGGSGQPGPSVDQLAQGITQLVQSWLAQNGLIGSDGSGSSADQSGSASSSDAGSGQGHRHWDDSGDSDHTGPRHHRGDHHRGDRDGGDQDSSDQGSGDQSSGGSGQSGPGVDQLAQGVTQLVQSWLAQNGLTGPPSGASGSGAGTSGAAATPSGDDSTGNGSSDSRLGGVVRLVDAVLSQITQFLGQLTDAGSGAGGGSASTAAPTAPTGAGRVSGIPPRQQQSGANGTNGADPSGVAGTDRWTPEETEPSADQWLVRRLAQAGETPSSGAVPSAPTRRGPGVDQLFSTLVDFTSGVVGAVGGQDAGQRTHRVLTGVADQVESAMATGAALQRGAGVDGSGSAGQQWGVPGPRSVAEIAGRGDSGSGSTDATTTDTPGISGCDLDAGTGCPAAATARSTVLAALRGRGPPSLVNLRNNSNNSSNNNRVESALSRLSPTISSLIEDFVPGLTRPEASKGGRSGSAHQHHSGSSDSDSDSDESDSGPTNRHPHGGVSGNGSQTTRGQAAGASQLSGVDQLAQGITDLVREWLASNGLGARSGSGSGQNSATGSSGLTGGGSGSAVDPAQQLVSSIFDLVSQIVSAVAGPAAGQQTRAALSQALASQTAQGPAGQQGSPGTQGSQTGQGQQQCGVTCSAGQPNSTGFQSSLATRPPPSLLPNSDGNGDVGGTDNPYELASWWGPLDSPSAANQALNDRLAVVKGQQSLTAAQAKVKSGAMTQADYNKAAAAQKTLSTKADSEAAQLTPYTSGLINDVVTGQQKLATSQTALDAEKAQVAAGKVTQATYDQDQAAFQANQQQVNAQTAALAEATGHDPTTGLPTGGSGSSAGCGASGAFTSCVTSAPNTAPDNTQASARNAGWRGGGSSSQNVC